MKTIRTLTIIFILLAGSGLQEIHAQWFFNGNHIFNTNSGNVGIGTDSPSTLLYVSKTMTEPTITVRNSGGFGGATYSMIDDASGADWKFKAVTNGGFKIRDHAFGLDVIVVEPNSALHSLYIDDGGNIGIGTSTPAERFHVIGSVYVTGSGNIGGAIVGDGDFKANSLNGVINCGGGNISYANILSDTEVPAISFAAGDEDLYIEDDLEVVGTAYKTGGGSWSTLSDQRYKKNIEPYQDGLAQVMQIKPVSFQYNDKAFVTDHEQRYVGVLAQDVMNIAPYMVTQQPMGQIVREIENGVEEILKEGEMVYTFDPSALDYLLINSVKEQQAIIEKQQQQISDLRNENEMIRQELERIGTQLKKVLE